MFPGTFTLTYVDFLSVGVQ
uniref:Uncharacterized protein n=1 Tax=Anguilla anguilla TaxID=7936 RepID=A0A0E9P9T1_ANGAN